jgi:hypothetical protein
MTLCTKMSMLYLYAAAIIYIYIYDHSLSWIATVTSKKSGGFEPKHQI